jgi:hypothetical protein
MPQYPNQQAALAVSASGTTVIAASVAGQTVRLHKLNFSSSAAVAFKLQSVSPTGAIVDLTGAYQNVVTFSDDFDGQLQTGAGNSLAINLSTAATVGGFLSYFEHN